MVATQSTICGRPLSQTQLTPSVKLQASSRIFGISRPATRRSLARFVVRAKAPAEVLKETRSIIAEQLGKETSEVAPDSKFVDLGADSLDTVEIMMALEEKFEIQLDEQGAEKIETVQQASDMITKVIESK